VPAERGLDLLPLVQPKQAVIDEDAGEPLADRPVHQCRRHTGIDPAGESADHAGGRAHHLTDFRDFRLDEMPAVQPG
jgi:hypothetical protein